MNELLAENMLSAPCDVPRLACPSVSVENVDSRIPGLKEEGLPRGSMVVPFWGS